MAAEDSTASASNTRLALLVGLVGGVSGIVVALAALVSPLLQYFGQQREQDVKMVEIGIGILRAPPTEDITAIREWAIDLIETNSGKKLSAPQRAAVIRNALPYISATTLSPTTINKPAYVPMGIQ